MAKIHPTLDVISRLKVRPTEGELYLLNYLKDNFDEDAEVYFQPFLNQERPDIIILHKTKGVIIIEVKDWHLEAYTLNEDNNWFLKDEKNTSKQRSPFAQVFGYKNTIFDLHINGFLEKKIQNTNFYRCIDCFVYFHYETKKSVKAFYTHPIDKCNELIRDNLDKFNAHKINKTAYEKIDEYLNRKLKKLRRDLKLAFTKDQLNNLKFPYQTTCDLYPESVYLELVRFLNPPYHTLTQGIHIKYTKQQTLLATSKENRRIRVSGGAGAGKTLTLAKLAVNAHKRHEDTVLILTYNLTLRNYIHDRLSDIRENFSWSYFVINNYHQFINHELFINNIEIEYPTEFKNNQKALELYYDAVYSDESLFEDCNTHRYQTILIDEVQDYKAEWINIIKKYFLTNTGEMVLFGDEKQDIYSRTGSNKRIKQLEGFGHWQILNSRFRFNDHYMPELAKDFRNTFLKGNTETKTNNENLTLDLQIGAGFNRCLNYHPKELAHIVKAMFEIIREYSVHPNDIVVLSSHTEQLIEIDYLIRTTEGLNTETTTTFANRETVEKIRQSEIIFDSEIDKVNNNKKYNFWNNSGNLKLSTIHSYKGYESPTVFLIINEYDNPELVYVGATRAKLNLVVFVLQNSKYEKFFKEHLDTKSPYKKC